MNSFTKNKDRTLTVGIVGPFPPILGGTASFLKRFVVALENRKIICKIFNTGKGKPGLGITDRINRLLLFIKLANQVFWADFEILHCHAVNWENLIGTALIMLAAKLRNKPVLLTLHAGNLIDNISKNGIHIIFSKFIFSFPASITTVSPQLRNAINSFGFKNVGFIPNSLEYISESEIEGNLIPVAILNFINSHKPVLVCVGALEPIHGIDLLINSLIVLKKTYPNIGAIIIAFKSVNQEYKTKIEKLMDESNLDDSVIFPTSLPSILSIVAKADVFIRPTLSDGDSIAVREALGLNIKVVASEVGFRPEGVFLFHAGDPINLEEKIREALLAPKINIKAQVNESDTIDQYINIFLKLRS